MDLWKKKIIVVRVNGTHWKKVFAVMVTANIVQISDAWMTVVNIERELKMRKQEIIYIAVDNKDADCFIKELCKPGTITDSSMRVNWMKKSLETSEFQVRVVPLSDFRRFVPMSSIEYYLQSDKPFTTQLSLLENRYDELQMIKMRLSTSAKEIGIEKLIYILNGMKK